MTAEDVLRRYVEAFLTAGGSVSWGEWNAMDQPVRDVFEAAGVAVESARLSRLALALGNAEASAALAQDGGVAASYLEILGLMREVSSGGKQ